MAGGGLLPSSIDVGGAGGNLFPSFYAPATSTVTNQGLFEGVGVVAALSADAPVVLQFNMPEVIPSGTLKLRTLAMANSTTGTAKLTIQDGSGSVGTSLGTTSLTTETQISKTWTTADILVENKLTLTATAPTANQVTTVVATFNTSGWTLAQASVWQFSLVWE